MEPLERYRWLQSKLLLTRMHGGSESEEDLILDEMDWVWYQLSLDEQTLLNSEGPQCWPDHEPQ